MSNVVVTLDERVRTWTAVLAAAGWPEIEQADTPHGVHLQSKGLSQHLQEQEGITELALVQEIKELLSQGSDLAETLGYVLQQKRAGALAGFAAKGNLADLWIENTAVWDEAIDHLQVIVSEAPLISFCTKLLPSGRELPPTITICPTLTYPMLSTVLSTDGDNLVAAVPPPKAWGASSPWPYAEWADEVLGRVVRELAGVLLGPEMGNGTAEQMALMKVATATLFLEEAFGEDTGLSFMVQKKREEKLPRLPIAVELMRDHLADPDERPLLERFA